MVVDGPFGFTETPSHRSVQIEAGDLLGPEVWVKDLETLKWKIETPRHFVP